MYLLLQTGSTLCRTTDVLKELDDAYERYRRESDSLQRRKLQMSIQRALIRSQELGDEKIQIAGQMVGTEVFTCCKVDRNRSHYQSWNLIRPWWSWWCSSLHSSFFCRWSWWKTAPVKSTGIRSFSCHLRRFQRATFPRQPPWQPVQCPWCRRRRPTSRRGKPATMTRSGTSSRLVRRGETRPEGNAPDARKMETPEIVTEGWTTRTKWAWERPAKRERKPHQRRRKGQRASLRERCLPRTCPSTQMSPHTACVSRSPTARWLAATTTSVPSSGFTSLVWDCIINPKASGTALNVEGRMRRPWTRPWRGPRRRGPTTGSCYHGTLLSQHHREVSSVHSHHGWKQ